MRQLNRLLQAVEPLHKARMAGVPDRLDGSDAD